MINKQNRTSKAFYLTVVLLFCFSTAQSQTTWYSYQTGKWTNPDVWTTDPGGTTLVNPDNLIPGDGDAVVILPSRTVTLRSGNVTTTGLDITIQASGVLDDSISYFTTTLAALRGQGTLKLRSVNFPAATINSFVQTGGGTVEYYNSGNFSLPAGQTSYNNLTINCMGATALQLSDISINGNLKVQSGTYQINDASANRRSLVIKGDLTVNTGASIKVGTGNTTGGSTDPTQTGTGGSAPFLDYYINYSHRIEIYGNLINNGTVKFTNQSYPVFNAFPANGIASVFFRGTGDKTITCNGTTDFYNLVVDKGTDQSCVITVNSAGYDRFRIFGANNASEFAGADDNNPNIRKALWIRTGTLKLNGYIFIPSLVEGSASGSGDFYIPGNGAIIIDGPDVVVMGTIDDYRVVNLAYNVSAPNNGSAGITTVPSVVPSGFSIYGKVQINDGYLYVGEIGRLIAFGTSAQFIVNGGTVDTKQFQSAGTGKISYWQTGGNVVLRGRFQRSLKYNGTLAEMIASIGSSDYLNTNRSYYDTSTPLGTEPSVGTLSIYQDANIFHMEGGTIKIYDPSGATAPSRAIQINSDPSNTSVTGGSIEIYLTAGTGTVTGGVADASYGIATKAPLYNLTITRNSGSQSATLLTIPAASGITAVTNPPLVVLNDLTLTEPVANAAAVLNASGFDVKAGGNFIINTNAEYTPGTNHTVLNGDGAQTFTNNGAITSGLYRFSVDKNSGEATLGSDFTVRDSLAIYGGTLDDGGHTLYVRGNIYNAGTHKGTGRIQLNGAGAGYQLLTASATGSPTLGNLEINSTTSNAIAAQLGSDFSVSGLIMTLNKKINIGSYRLTIGGNGITHVPAFGTGCMIQTNGMASDGGLRMRVDASSLTSGQTKLFPIGVSGQYTPAIINGNTMPGTGIGYVTFIPVHSKHPAATDGKKQLIFYWKSKATGMPSNSTVYYSFSDNNNGDWTNGINTAYVLLSGTTGWQSGGVASNPDININGVPNSNGFISADITAGNPSAYNNIKAYYSIASGPWNTNIWSWESHTGANCNSYPGNTPSDIVYIGGITGRNDSISFPAANLSVSSITIEGSFTNDERRPTLNLQSNGGRLTVDIIQGAGKLASSSATLFSGSCDLGGLMNNDTAMVQFFGNTMTNFPTGITSYPTLLITGGNTKILPASNIVIRKNLRIADESNVNNYLRFNTSGDLTVYGDLQILNGGKLIVPVSTTARNVNIYGDINFQYRNTNNENAIEASSGNGTAHKLNFYGDTIFSGASDLTFNPAGNNKIDLYIKDPGRTVVSYGTGVYKLNRLYIQKDVLTDTVYFKNNFTLNEVNNYTANKSLNLTAGTLILSDISNGSASTINLNLSRGTGVDSTYIFKLNSTSALILRNGSKINIKGNSAGSGIRLDGLLKAEGTSEINLADGTAVNTGYIEYTGSGSSVLILQDASVLKADQVRRSLSLTTGVLKYTQAGSGNATIYGKNADATRAKFEVTGTGSSFNMSGTSSLTVINGGGGTTYGDLYLQPESSVITGGDIYFGTGANSQSFRMDATVDLKNLTLNTNGTANTLDLMIHPLVLNGNFLLNNTNSVFNANNINVTVNGNFTNNGTYNAGTNNTIFNGNSQILGGSSSTDFYDFTVTPAISLTLSHDVLVINDMTIDAGSSLISQTYNVEVRGDVVNNGNITTAGSPATNRLYLHGSELQAISGTGTYGRIELDNASGARLLNNLSLTEDFTLTSGILNINQYLLTLGPNSSIKGTGFDKNKMIVPDGVLSNIGIKKYFTAGYSGAFLYPLGTSGKYTPAIMSVTSTTAGFLRINAINERHPATLSPYNVLKYYWEGESNITGFQGSVTFNYSPSDVVGTESDYVAAHLIIPPGTDWSKAAPGSSTDNVNETAHAIVFNFQGSGNLGGNYTAGEDASVPNVIPLYTSNVVTGNWEAPSSWIPEAPDGGPNGFRVIILSGHTIYTDGNKRFCYSTTIDGTLDVGTSYGHNLGLVSGTGRLKVAGPNIPAGRFDSFFSCEGGSLEYSGNTDYTIVADRLDTIRNLYFTGSGARILPDKNLVICNQLEISGPNVDNSVNNRKLSIGGTFDLTSGHFLSGSGTNATVVFNGINPQAVNGFNTSTGSPLNNLEIINSSGLTLSSTIEINGNLLLTNGVITTSESNMLKMINQSSTTSVIPAGGSSASFVNGPMSKYLFSGTSFIFPIGKGSRYGKLQLLNVQNNTWQAEYFDSKYSNTTVSGTLSQVSATEYWKVISPSDGATAKVQLRWDAKSDISPLNINNGINDIRVAGFDGSQWIEEASDTPTGDDYNGTVQTSANIIINNTKHPQFFTLASVSRVKPTILMGISPIVCINNTIAYLPYTTITGEADQYKITYDAAAQSQGFTSDPDWVILLSNPIATGIPGISTAGVYNGTIQVRTSGDPSNVSVATPFTVTLSKTNNWTGVTDVSWNTNTNWDCNYVPYPESDVVIANVSNKPVLNSGASGAAHDLTISSASSLTVTGNTLAISGTITNNGLFTATDGTVEFNGTSAQSVAANLFAGNTIDGLNVDNASGVTLQGPLNVTGVVSVLNGNLASNGNLTLVSTAAQTALIDGSGSGNVTGNVTMQRYLSSGFGYKYFSSPFQSATVSEFGDDMNLAASFPSLYKYDESRTSSGWVSYVTATNPLVPLAGYTVNFGSSAAPNTADITGVVNNGSLSVELYNHNNLYTKGFNLVGNPYPSPIDWNSSAWTKTNIDNALYFFSASTDDQYGGIYSSYVNGIKSGDGLSSNIIPSMQGFFIHVKDDVSYPVTGSLGINNNVRVTDQSQPFLKSTHSKSSESEETRSIFRISAGFTDYPQLTDPAVIYFDDVAQPVFEGDMDALKMMNTDLRVPNFYSLIAGGTRLSINALPTPEDTTYVIPLGIKTYLNGTVSFKVKDILNLSFAEHIYLVDATTGSEQDMLVNNEYRVNLNAGEYKERFSIKFVVSPTGFNDVNVENELFEAYCADGMLKLNIISLPDKPGIITVTNLTGQVIFKNRVFEEGHYDYKMRFYNGIYIVSLTTGNIRSSKKLFFY